MIVTDRLPAEASFGFVNEMRARSSGGASVSLLLSHWERLQARSVLAVAPTLSAARPLWEPEDMHPSCCTLQQRIVQAALAGDS